MIFVRHYFPGVNIDELDDDEEFATLCGDAVWMHSQMMQSSMLGLFGAPAKGKGQAPPKKPVRKKK